MTLLSGSWENLRGTFFGSGGAACTEASAFLARTSGLNVAHRAAYGNLICGLVSDGVWAKLDMLQIYATQDSTTALLNLVQNDFNATTHGSPTFTADRGFTGVEASTTVYIDTGFHATLGTLYNRNTAHLSSWQITNGQSANASMGAYYATITWASLAYPRWTDNKAYNEVNTTGGGNPGITNTDSRGHFIFNRSGASATETYINGASIGTGTPASRDAPVIPQINFYSLGMYNNGTPAGYGQQMAMVSSGKSLDATQASNFYTRLRTYMTAVGVP